VQRSGHIVELAFPALALLVGVILYFQHPTLYLGFTWWLWFLTPEVRRLVDYQMGWNPISPVMIAPFLVTGVAALTVLRCLPQLLERPAFFPFSLVLMGLNYGYTIGLVRAGPVAATYGLLTWIVPVVFGFHVAARWRQYPLYRDALQRVFLWGALVMGRLRHRAIRCHAALGCLLGQGQRDVVPQLLDGPARSVPACGAR
jgi:hypothetical protein